MTFTHALATDNYGPAKFIVSSNVFEGTHTTLASALAVASAGDTVFLRTSVTENVTIPPGVNIAAWYGNNLNTPSITGTVTMSGAGTSSISGITLITNSANIIAVSGSAASILNIDNCFLNCSNNTGIAFSSSSSSAQINLFNCQGNLGNNAVTYFANSSAGTMNIFYCNFTNTAGSSTASTVSAGTLLIEFTRGAFPITSTGAGGTGTVGIGQSQFDTSAVNATTLTINGSGGGSTNNSTYTSGTASAISIGATYSMSNLTVSSSNTNAITGAGTYSGVNINFSGSSHQVNVTTQSQAAAAYGLTQGSVVSAGGLGERFSSATTGVNLLNSTPTTITSQALTAGIWDISILFNANGSSNNVNAGKAGISTVTNTFQGNSGDQFGLQAIANSNNVSVSVPAFRAIVAAGSTTTYFLIGQANFGVGSATGDGRISATRVG